MNFNEVAIINKVISTFFYHFNISFEKLFINLYQSYDSRATSCIYKSFLLIISIKNPDCLVVLRYF